MQHSLRQLSEQKGCANSVETLGAIRFGHKMSLPYPNQHCSQNKIKKYGYLSLLLEGKKKGHQIYEHS